VAGNLVVGCRLLVVGCRLSVVGCRLSVKKIFSSLNSCTERSRSVRLNLTRPEAAAAAAAAAAVKA